jgi:hypothetical protein
MPIERVEAFAAQGVTRIIGGATATDPERQREELTRSPSGSLHVTDDRGVAEETFDRVPTPGRLVRRTGWKHAERRRRSWRCGSILKW